MSNSTTDTKSGLRAIRGTFFALAGALFGALCAADSNVTMTLIANAFANDQMHIVVDEFVRDGGGLRGAVGAMFGVLIGTGLFWLMSGTPGRSRDDSELSDSWLSENTGEYRRR